jgi:hypothetical protein
LRQSSGGLQKKYQFTWRRGTQQNDIQHNDTQHKKLGCDTQAEMTLSKNNTKQK